MCGGAAHQGGLGAFGRAERHDRPTPGSGSCAAKDAARSWIMTAVRSEAPARRSSAAQLSVGCMRAWRRIARAAAACVRGGSGSRRSSFLLRGFRAEGSGRDVGQLALSTRRWASARTCRPPSALRALRGPVSGAAGIVLAGSHVVGGALCFARPSISSVPLADRRACVPNLGQVKFKRCKHAVANVHVINRAHRSVNKRCVASTCDWFMLNRRVLTHWRMCQQPRLVLGISMLGYLRTSTLSVVNISHVF